MGKRGIETGGCVARGEETGKDFEGKMRTEKERGKLRILRDVVKGQA